MRSAITPYLTAALLLASGASFAQTVELEGVKLESTVKVGATTLQLNGAGVRTRVVFKVYVAGLYVPQKSNNAATLLADKGARRVAITMLRGVDADAFVKALNDGLHNNHVEAQLAAMKPQIDALNAILISAGEVKKGDVIHFDYLPDIGTRTTLNGRALGNVIAGDAFFTAVLRTWLGDKTSDAGLKKGLLGT
jgi:hypothetical protein